MLAPHVSDKSGYGKLTVTNRVIAAVQVKSASLFELEIWCYLSMHTAHLIDIGL